MSCTGEKCEMAPRMRILADTVSVFGEAGGMPAVCFGPYAEQAHGIGERVYLPGVVQTAQVMGMFVRDWCGVT